MSFGEIIAEMNYPCPGYPETYWDVANALKKAVISNMQETKAGSAGLGGWVIVQNAECSH